MNLRFCLFVVFVVSVFFFFVCFIESYVDCFLEGFLVLVIEVVVVRLGLLLFCECLSGMVKVEN